MMGTWVLEMQYNNEEECKIFGFSAFNDKDGQQKCHYQT